MDNYLTDSDLHAIRGFRNDYRAAALRVGDIPWQALAAIHYRESSFARTGEERYCGPYAYDPGGSGEMLARLIDRTMRLMCQIYEVAYTGGTLDDDFTMASTIAAWELKQKSRAQMILSMTGEVVEAALADAFWGYNGRSDWHTPDGNKDAGAKSYRFSPYVSSNPKAGIFLRLRGTVPCEKTAENPVGRKHVDMIDQRPGAIIVYREIISRELDIEVA